MDKNSRSRIVLDKLEKKYAQSHMQRVFVTDLLHIFFSSTSYFLAKQVQLHYSRKNGRVTRISREVLHELYFFTELLHGRICEIEFAEQFQILS